MQFAKENSINFIFAFLADFCVETSYKCMNYEFLPL